MRLCCSHLCHVSSYFCIKNEQISFVLGAFDVWQYFFYVAVLLTFYTKLERLLAVTKLRARSHQAWIC